MENEQIRGGDDTLTSPSSFNSSDSTLINSIAEPSPITHDDTDYIKQQQQQENQSKQINNNSGINTTLLSGKMEGLISCKQCNATTPRCNKSCNNCGSELGERCWRCNYLCKPGSKFCFKCNVKLQHIPIPTLDSIAAIPPFRNGISTPTTTSSTSSPSQHSLMSGSTGMPGITTSKSFNISSQRDYSSGVVSSTPIKNIKSIIESINIRNTSVPATRKFNISPSKSKTPQTNTDSATPTSQVQSPSPKLTPISTLTTTSITIKQDDGMDCDDHGGVKLVFTPSSPSSPPQLSVTPPVNNTIENRITPSTSNPELYSQSLLGNGGHDTKDNNNTTQVDPIVYEKELIVVPNQDNQTNNNSNSINENSSNNSQEQQRPIQPLSESTKRKSFNGYSVINQFIDAFPTPPNITTTPPPQNEKKSGHGRRDSKHHNHIHGSNSTIQVPNGADPIVLSPKSKELQRSFIIKEIISTELDYIHDLETTLTIFYYPLRDELKLMNNEECASVFSNIEEIRQVNKQLYQQLTSQSSTIGQVFSTMADSLDVYSVYCNYHQNSIECLNNLILKYPAVEEFFNEKYSKPELRGMNLHSFLIKPIQRITKYPLLLRELLKNTSEENSDYAQVQVAVLKIEQIVNTINKEKMEMENWQRTMQIIQSLKGAENLQLSARQLINEGSIQIVEGYIDNNQNNNNSNGNNTNNSNNIIINNDSKRNSSMKFKKGFFFLFNDLFLFTKQKGSSYKLQFAIPLDSVLVNGSVCREKHLFTLVEIGVGGKRWTFLPQSKAQSQLLIITIQKLIEKCWDNGGGNGASGSSRPSLAVPTTNNNGGGTSPSLSPNGIHKKKLSHRLVKSLVNMKSL